MKVLLPLASAALLATTVAPLVTHAQQFSPMREITVAPGYGVTIIPASPITKVWVDDGSKLGVDFDRPIEQGASIIHVYQSKKTQSFSIDGSTMMTLISEDGEIQKIKVKFASGSISQDSLDLRKGNGGNRFNATLAASNTSASVSTPSSRDDRIAIILKGLELALNRGSIKRNSELHYGVEQFIQLYANGRSLEAAQRKTGVMIEVITRLAEMGSSSLNQPPKSPVIEEEIEAKAVVAKRFTLEDFDDSKVAKPKKKKSRKEKKQKSLKVAKIEKEDKAPLEERETPAQQSLKEPELAEVREKAVEPTAPSISPQKDNVHTIANKLVKGLYAANLSGEIGWNARPVWKINTVIRLLRTERYSLEEARSYARLDLKTLNRILQLSQPRISLK